MKSDEKNNHAIHKLQTLLPNHYLIQTNSTWIGYNIRKHRLNCTLPYNNKTYNFPNTHFETWPILFLSEKTSSHLAVTSNFKYKKITTTISTSYSNLNEKNIFCNSHHRFYPWNLVESMKLLPPMSHGASVHRRCFGLRSTFVGCQGHQRIFVDPKSTSLFSWRLSHWKQTNPRLPNTSWGSVFGTQKHT